VVRLLRAGNDSLSAGGALGESELLLIFLREPELELLSGKGSGPEHWEKDIFRDGGRVGRRDWREEGLRGF